MVLSLHTEQRANCFRRLRAALEPLLPGAEVFYLDLGGVRIVRILACEKEAGPMIRRQLAWSLTAPVPSPDATLILWRERVDADFHRRVLGLDVEDDGSGDNLILTERKGEDLVPFGEVSYANRTLRLTDGTVTWYATERFEPEEWIREGHLFVHDLYRILDTPSSHLVHGACLGLDGKGILLCARGQRGKSTLAVTAMLRGFDYVSDDYLILEKSREGLLASPIYSIITLSPTMYTRLYDDLDRARFVCNNARKDKYVFDISGYGDTLRRRYPVLSCMFPEIDPDAKEARIEPCSPAEKGRAITHLVHSTILQMQAQGDAGTVRKLISFLQELPFHTIRLSPDIYGNVECLRTFLQTQER